MPTIYIILIIALAVLLLLVGYFAFRLYSLYHSAKFAWKQLDEPFRQRQHFVQEILEALSGYMSHDKELLTNVQQAVDRAKGAKTDEEQMSAEKNLYEAINSLTTIETHHPTTVVSPAYSSVKKEIVGVQAVIDATVEDYNKQVDQLNALRNTFPYPFIAKMLGMQGLEKYQH